MTPDNTPPALFVDQYELTMAQVYYENAMTDTAVFELAVRKAPESWGYLIAAGLDRALRYLEGLRFTAPELMHLRKIGVFSEDFLDTLSSFRFTGDVWAPLEGTVVYPHEPLIQVIAPLPEAQIVETALINLLAYPTLVASKAARVVDAAAPRRVIEFGGRRAHSPEAAVEAARATYIAGFAATSNVEAGRRYGIPTTGTMAHSYVLAAGNEGLAFDTFASRFFRTTLLVDTFDTDTGIDTAIQVAKEHDIGAIRLDSGDLLEDSRTARLRLDAADLLHVDIVASGGLDEYSIGQLVAHGAPIDVYAAGTSVVAPPDAATLDSAYKLVEYQGQPKRKYSAGKESKPWRKQVWRLPNSDLITRFKNDPPAHAEALLKPVMRHGKRTRIAMESLDRIRRRGLMRGPRLIVLDESLEESGA